MTAAQRLYDLQIVQLEHDESYHKDVVIMPLAERVKHMALHNAKYVGYFSRRWTLPMKRGLIEY